MTTKDTIGKSENSGGNTYNEYNIKSIDNFNPNARVVQNLHYAPIKPMFITKIINKLYELSANEIPTDEIDLKRYKIHEKEDFNRLNRWKTDIQMYAPYRGQMNEIYQGFEDLGQNRRESVYQWLTREYRRLHDELDADELFDALKDYVTEKVNKDITLFDDIAYEEMEMSVCIVLVDAFIECRIFEKPS